MKKKIAIIDKTVKKMKKIDIEIFELYYYSAMNYNEISNALNISNLLNENSLFCTEDFL